MRIAVIGAGVIGVTSAYELAAANHEVTVFEALGSAASGTSFANAGVVSPGYAAPWAAPGMPGKALRGFMHEHAAVRIAGLGGPHLWSWLWRWWRACDARGYATRRRQMLDLALSSQARLRELTKDLDLSWERRRGLLVLLRGDDDVRRAQPQIDAMKALGLAVKLIDEAACRALEPGLRVQTPLAAGLHWPDDDIGNCRQFTQQLLDHAVARGVTIRTRHTVRALRPDDRGVMLELDPRAARETEARFDAAVVCAGAAAVRLLRSVGVRVPLVPVHGYSITAPLRPPADPLVETTPRAGLMDEAYKVAITRIGDRLRVAGSAELGGHDDRLSPRALATLYKVLDDWFPSGADHAMAVPWKGARPMLPDGPPVIGATRHARLWVNLGHGSSGWALACGSARLLVDLIADRAPSIDARGFSIDRWR
jgi:D-amino-acid dehydrogenase